MAKTIVIVGALDTKGEEFAYVKALLKKKRLKTVVVDFGVLGEPAFEPDISRNTVRFRRQQFGPMFTFHSRRRRAVRLTAKS